MRTPTWLSGCSALLFALLAAHASSAAAPVAEEARAQAEREAVVLFLLSVPLAVLLPRRPGLSESRRNSPLRRLAGMAQALHEDAAFKKKAWL